MRPDTFVIKNVIVDLVYGKSITGACSKRQALSQKTSLTFLSDDATVPFTDGLKNFGHLQSGAPGYLKGQPILIGKKAKEMVNTATGSQIEKEFIKYNLEGFPLRGQDQNGNCLWLKEPVTEFKASKTYTPPTDNGVIEPLEDINEKLYLDNSVLTFEDSMLFGCSVELTFDELADFCNN